MTDKKNRVTYPTPEEVETSDTRLKGFAEAQTALENIGVDVPETLLAQMEEVTAQTREKLPKWVTDPKWIEKLETLKEGLEKQIQSLEGMKGVNKKAIQLLRDQLKKVNNVLDEPKEYLHGKSKKEYAETISGTSYEKEGRELSPEQADQLLGTLKTRFELPENERLRKAIDFADVEKSLRASPEKLYALHKLEETGGEPQVIGIDGDEFVFEDRCKESPSGRRNLDADQAAAQADEFGADMQSPDAYKAMQKTGEYDLNSGSWLKTSAAHREKTGDAMYGRRYEGGVGVGEYNAGRHFPFRGWRASLRVKKA